MLFILQLMELVHGMIKVWLDCYALNECFEDVLVADLEENFILFPTKSPSAIL